MEKRVQPLDGFIQIEWPRLETLLAAKGEELGRETRGAFGGIRNLAQ
jgi:hypothetical protein